jgi:hypothetical protein
MIDRLYAKTGIKLLGLLDLSFLFQTADNSESGVLNLLGCSNPIAQIPSNHVVWGDVAGWTTQYHVVWGDNLQSPSGQHVVWGDSEHVDNNHVVWGDSISQDGGR